MHVPVLKREVKKFLLTDRGRVYVDCTVGLGGHSKELLKSKKDAFLIGIDLDEESLNLADKNLKNFEGRYALYRANFKDLDLVIKEEGYERVDGILMDLGISMFQLKEGRGFSFQVDSPLDMRMFGDQSLTAYRVVNEYTERELARIIREYGEERLAPKIARAIVGRRSKKPIETTLELANIVESVYPPSLRRRRIHPATKTFQAIRIEVNRELENLKEALEKTPDLLNRGGRLVVISFHSLEDRIVKNFFRDRKEMFRVLTRKPVVPSEEEIRMNPASRSAKLRAGERL